MRIVKDAEVRKNEILDAADELFNKKGFDGTSTSDILEKVGIARGTLYYHFKSKEEIMDALIARYCNQILKNGRQAAQDKSIPVYDRIVRSIMSMNIDGQGGKEIIEHINKPQNALMHQKMQQIVFQEVPPILADIIQEGIDEGLFDTPYPYECTEMILIYANSVFDSTLIELSEEETLTRIRAFIFNIERMLKADPGSFSCLTRIFEQENDTQ